MSICSDLKKESGPYDPQGLLGGVVLGDRFDPKKQLGPNDPGGIIGSGTALGICIGLPKTLGPHDPGGSLGRGRFCVSALTPKSNSDPMILGDHRVGNGFAYRL